MSALRAVVHREARIRATNATFIFWDLFSPLAYLLVFGVTRFGIAANTAWSFFLDRDNGIFYEMLTYPLSRGQYLLGKVLFNVAIAILQAAIAVGRGAGLLGVPVAWGRLPLLLAGVVGGTAGWFFFYAAFALKIRRNDAFNAVTSIFYFVFLFASSMFYPLEP